jgi:translocation and assembly module TamB
MWRAIKRTLLGLAATIVLAIAFVVIAIHTDWGRDVARRQVEKVLSDVFVGGGHIGKLEGSPFGELVARDVVLDGPDGKPAFSIGTLHVKVRLLPLLHHQATIDELVAEDVTAILARDPKGHLEVANLLVPGPKSKWHVDLRAVTIARAHVTYEAAGQLVHADDVRVDGNATIEPGGPIDAAATVSGIWREQARPFEVTTRMHSGDDGVEFPYAVARLGDATVSASSVLLGHGRYAGNLAAIAPAAMLRDFGVDVPGDVVASVRATEAAGSHQIAVTASVGTSPIHALLAVVGDRLAGVIAADGVDVAAVSRGKITGAGSAVAIVDAAPGKPGELPTAHAIVQASGAFDGFPAARIDARIATRGNAATVIADVSGHATAPTPARVGRSGTSASSRAAVVRTRGPAAPPFELHLEAELHRAGSAIELIRSHVVGHARDLTTASAGRIAARGTFEVDVSAKGALSPAMDLAVTGRIDGAHLAIPGTSAGALHASIDARSLPSHPMGRARVELDDLVRGDMQLGQLSVDAANRSDGTIAVQVRSKPKLAPVVIDADAVVTPGATIAVALERHHVRVHGNDWTGTGGTLAIGRDVIEVHDLTSTAGSQRVAVAGTYHRATGDFTATVDANGVQLDGRRGHADAHIDVTRTHARWSGDAKVAVRGVAIDATPKPVNLDGDLEIHLRDRALVMTGEASSAGIGTARLELDVTTPANVADVVAWQHVSRDAIHDLELELHRVDLAGIAKLTHGAPMQGQVNGTLAITPDGVRGSIKLDRVVADVLRASGPISTDITIAQTSPTELAPTGRIQLGHAGTVAIDAKLAIPPHLFDPRAWRALGRDVLTGAKIRTDAIQIDQGLLARFGVVTEVHGELAVAVDVDRGGRTMRAMVDVRRAHGGPIAKPIDLHVDATADGETTTALLAIRRHGITIVSGTAKLAVPLDAIRGTTPIAGTIEIPSVAAADILGVLGRSDIAKGSLGGKIAIAGTVGHPTIDAKLSVSNIAVVTTSHTKGTQELTKLDLAASWDGSIAKLGLDATESQGGKLHVVAQGSPAKLAAATATIEASNLDLQPLAVFAPDPGSAVRGKLDGKLAITGFVAATAKLAGNIKITNARVPLAPTVGTLHRATVNIGIDEHQLEIAIDGRLGGGTVTAKGKANLDKGDVSGADIKMQLRNVSPIGSLQPKINADVTTKITRGGDRWKLDVVVDHASVYVPEDRGEKLAEVGEPTDMRFVEAAPTKGRTARRPTHTGLEVDITLHDTNLESDELRGILRGKLAISIGDGVGIVGDIDADRGDVDLFGQRYTVDRAAVHFDGSTDPLLDVSITHDFPDVTTTTIVQGRLSAPKLTMTSEPAVYSQGQLLGFLLGGEPNGDPEAGSARQTATDAGASLIGAKLGGYMRKALPVSLDVLRYESATASSSAAVLVGTWLTRTLFLAYRQHIDALPDENTGEGTLEYWLSRRLVLEGTVGDRNVDGIDLLWRRRW